MWTYIEEEIIVEEPTPEPPPAPVEEEEPEPPKPVKTDTGTTVVPVPEIPKCGEITMSSAWKDARNSPCNPVKTQNFNAYWGQGEFTCIHTLNDPEGPWWKSKFNSTVTIT